MQNVIVYLGSHSADSDYNGLTVWRHISIRLVHVLLGEECALALSHAVGQILRSRQISYV